MYETEEGSKVHVLLFNRGLRIIVGEIIFNDCCFGIMLSVVGSFIAVDQVYLLNFNIYFSLQR